MKWWQLWWAIIGCYAVSVFVSIPVAILIAVNIIRREQESHITQTQTILIDPDRQRSDLIERIAKEQHDGMRSRASNP